MEDPRLATLRFLDWQTSLLHKAGDWKQAARVERAAQRLEAKIAADRQP